MGCWCHFLMGMSVSVQVTSRTGNPWGGENVQISRKRLSWEFISQWKKVWEKLILKGWGEWRKTGTETLIKFPAHTHSHTQHTPSNSRQWKRNFKAVRKMPVSSNSQCNILCLSSFLMCCFIITGRNCLSAN